MMFATNIQSDRFSASYANLIAVLQELTSNYKQRVQSKITHCAEFALMIRDTLHEHIDPIALHGAYKNIILKNAAVQIITL